MEALLKDKGWRGRNSLWLILAFLPYLNTLAFFYIGYKTKRRSWTGVGALFCLVYAALAVYEAVYGRTDSYGAMYFGFLLYALGIVLAFVFKQDYLKLLSRIQEREPQPHALLNDGMWCLQNSLWMLWSIVPGLGAASMFHIGLRARNRRWLAAGALLTVFFFLPTVACLSSFLEGPTDFLRKNTAVFTQIFGCILLMPAVQLYLSLTRRKEYLSAIAPGWEGARREYPCLNETGWRVKNSWWVLFGIFPYCGGAGLLFAGIFAKKWRWAAWGAAATVLFAATAVIGRMAQQGLEREAQEAVSAAFLLVRNVLWLATFVANSLLRVPYLEERAAIMGGYESGVDRELAEQDAFRSRMSGERAASEKTAAVPIPAEPRKPSETKVPPKARDTSEHPAQKADAQAKVDINACTQSELASLPGVSVADAKRAMEYRESRGGFGSVDDFVEALSVKPHFAVQLFELAVASRPEQQEGEPQKRARRSIDL